MCHTDLGTVSGLMLASPMSQKVLTQPTAYQTVAYQGADLEAEQLLASEVTYDFLSFSTCEFYPLHHSHEHCLETQ